MERIMTFDTAFKHLYAEELAPYGFQKIKGRRPYFVRMVGDEIVHVITYQNDFSYRPYKNFSVLWGTATVYRGKINFDINPKDTNRWTDCIRDELGYPILFQYREAITIEPGVTYATGEHDVDMMEELQRSIEVVKNITLPKLDKITTLYDCIENRLTNANIYEGYFDGTYHNKDNEGLLNFMVFDLKGFEKDCMKYIERADITYKENTKQHMNEQIAIFRNYTQDENFQQKLTDELERRKSQNQEILRNYGIKF